VIINYAGFRINQDMYDAYAEMDCYFLANYFTQITRYATGAFLRAKLGETLSARGIAPPHVFERREEAQAFLARIAAQTSTPNARQESGTQRLGVASFCVLNPGSIWSSKTMATD